MESISHCFVQTVSIADTMMVIRLSDFCVCRSSEP